MGRFLSAALILGLAGFALSQNARPGNAGVRAGWFSAGFSACGLPTVSLDPARSSGAGISVGTLFLVPGDEVSEQITYNNPPSQGPSEFLPEPMSLTLFGAGLIVIALMVRPRAHKLSKPGAKANSRGEWISEVGRLT